MAARRSVVSKVEHAADLAGVELRLTGKIEDFRKEVNEKLDEMRKEILAELREIKGRLK